MFIGIGRFLCIEAVNRGAYVYAVDRDAASLAKLQNDVQYSYSILFTCTRRVVVQSYTDYSSPRPIISYTDIAV